MKTMSIMKKNINGIDVYYNKELDIISENFADSNLCNSSGYFTRTVCSGIYDNCFEITTKCNQRCLNCFSFSSPVGGKEMPFSMIESTLQQTHQNRIRICISGGEPFLHSHIKDILALSGVFHDLNFVISSNGNFALSHDISSLLVNGKWLLALSLHGNKENHNKYTNSDSFDNVLEKIEQLHSKIPIHIYCVLHRFLSKMDVDYLLDLQSKYCLAFIRFITPRKVGRVDGYYGIELLDYIFSKTKDNSCAGIKNGYSHTEFINVDGEKRILG